MRKQKKHQTNKTDLPSIIIGICIGIFLSGIINLVLLHYNQPAVVQPSATSDLPAPNNPLDITIQATPPDPALNALGDNMTYHITRALANQLNAAYNNPAHDEYMFILDKPTITTAVPDTIITFTSVSNVTYKERTPYHVYSYIPVGTYGTIHSHPNYGHADPTPYCHPSNNDIYLWGKLQPDNQGPGYNIIQCANNTFGLYPDPAPPLYYFYEEPIMLTIDETTT